MSFVCTKCGEVIVIGPGGCGCTRRAAAEQFDRKMAKLVAETERRLAEDPEYRKMLDAFSESDLRAYLDELDAQARR